MHVLFVADDVAINVSDPEARPSSLVCRQRGRGTMVAAAAAAAYKNENRTSRVTPNLPVWPKVDPIRRGGWERKGAAGECKHTDASGPSEGLGCKLVHRVSPFPPAGLRSGRLKPPGKGTKGIAWRGVIHLSRVSGDDNLWCIEQIKARPGSITRKQDHVASGLTLPFRGTLGLSFYYGEYESTKG